MPMTMVVTRDVADRYRGFLASVMPEVAPGVYVSPEISKGVRERIWTVVDTWWGGMPGGSIVMAWREGASAGGLGLAMLGTPAIDLVDLDGVIVARRRSRPTPSSSNVDRVVEAPPRP